MPRFFFDHRNGVEFVRDAEGVVLATADEARIQAAATLGAIAKEVLPGTMRRNLAIDVSDENHKPLFRAALWFEVQGLS